MADLSSWADLRSRADRIQGQTWDLGQTWVQGQTQVQGQTWIQRRTRIQGQIWVQGHTPSSWMMYWWCNAVSEELCWFPSKILFDLWHFLFVGEVTMLTSESKRKVLSTSSPSSMSRVWLCLLTVASHIRLCCSLTDCQTQAVCQCQAPRQICLPQLRSTKLEDSERWRPFSSSSDLYQLA